MNLNINHPSLRVSTTPRFSVTRNSLPTQRLAGLGRNSFGNGTNVSEMQNLGEVLIVQPYAITTAGKMRQRWWFHFFLEHPVLPHLAATTPTRSSLLCQHSPYPLFYVKKPPISDINYHNIISLSAVNPKYFCFHRSACFGRRWASSQPGRYVHPLLSSYAHLSV